jgi:hypothetical protein
MKYDRSQADTRYSFMTEGAIPEQHWNLLAGEMSEEGWNCDYIRIDTGMAKVFALEGHRDGIHHIVVSDELAPAMLELRLQTSISPASGSRIS